MLPPSKQTPAVNALFLESIGPSLALITTSHETAFRETLPSTFKASSRLPKAATNGFLITEPTGTALVYLGAGSETDYATDIAVDSAGNAYVMGTTSGSNMLCSEFGGEQSLQACRKHSQ